MIGRLFRRTPPPVDATLWAPMLSRVPFAGHLDADRARRLQALVARFLHEKTITPVGGLALDPTQRGVLAVLCCLPLVEFGAEGLHGWSELVVHPEAFRVGRSHLDAAGVQHEWDDELIGESWQHGPLVLSWADVASDLAAPHDGFCVAVHEMAHKVDALDGLLDGTPPLPRDWQRAWAADFQRAFDGFVDAVDRGRDVAIDPYAAEAPEEFFAVCSEYHFSDPATLRSALPTVATHLARLYGPPRA